QRKGVSGGVLDLLSRNGHTPRGHYESEAKQNLQPNCNTRGKKKHQTVVYRKLILVSKMCLVNTHLENILCVLCSSVLKVFSMLGLALPWPSKMEMRRLSLST